MKIVRYLALAICVACCLPSLAQKEDWLPITPADLELKEVPGNPGAPAIQLYYANYVDDLADSEFVYTRIKILNEGGKKYADVEIPAGVGITVDNLKARTIHPDGSIVEFTGKPFEKTIFKGRGVKVLAKTFTLPDVTVGSIVEYKYKLNTFSSDIWILQHDLYTVRQSFSFHPAQVDARISWVSVNVPGKGPEKKSGGVELHLDAMPAFESEALMPPEDNYKPSVRFYYSRLDVNSADKFWDEIGKAASSSYEDYIGNHKEVRQAALEAIGNETDPEKKLRKLYARAQQIRNLSYERERTSKERKKEKIEELNRLVDVLKRGYGDQDDITALFVGMARAAGFEASVLMVTDREKMFFTKEFLSIRQFTPSLAVVKLNGKDVYLQPGVKLCPFGLLRWMNTSTPAMRLDKDKKTGFFIDVPPATYQDSLTRWTANVTLNDDGSLKGEIMVEFQGQEALEHRLDALDRDEAGRKQDAEKEMKEWLPEGAVVTLAGFEGWETGDSLVCRYKVELPGYATVTGKRILMPSSLFLAESKHAFLHAERKYPVYFPYAFTEHDRINITIPSGYKVESIPTQQDLKLDYASYRNLAQHDGKQLFVTQRILLFNGIYFDRGKYPEL